MHGTQTGKYRVYRCAVIAMAARVRCGSWRFFRHTYRRAVAAIAPKRSIRTRFNQSISAVLAPIAWMVLSMCCLAALTSFVGSYQRRKLVETRNTLGCPAAKAWRQFELVVGETLRRRGYAMEENRHGRCRPHQSDLAQRRLLYPGAVQKSVNVIKVAVSAKCKIYIVLARPHLRVRFKISWDKSIKN